MKNLTIEELKTTLTKVVSEIIEEDKVEEEKAHNCASHVKENKTGRKGKCINHTLLEDGSVTHYTVEFTNEIVENIPASELTVLRENEHAHAYKRDDNDHDELKERRNYTAHKDALLNEELKKKWCK
tara:strand:- start:75 stop:455 length:381 start_codon:yes stop_codon:yes gene_type:complete